MFALWQPQALMGRLSGVVCSAKIDLAETRGIIEGSLGSR